MTDAHLRILRVMARNSQRRLDADVAGGAGPHAASAARRHDLERTAARTRAGAAAAQARRRQADRRG